MKRLRSKTGERTDTSPYTDGAPLERQALSVKATGGLHTPPSSPEKDRPSKLRRHGSKILSVLRSLTNSASTASHVEPTPSSRPGSPHGIGKKLSLSFLKGQLEPTVVHRTQFKSRPSIISMDKGILNISLTPEASPSPETSPSNSGGESSSNTGKYSTTPGESTGKTSLESKNSAKSKAASQSSENKKVCPKQILVDSGSDPLTTIPEVETVEDPEPVPTIITAEKAAAAKVFFECHYNKLTSGQVTPRSLRRRELEGILYEEPNLSLAYKEEKRRAWARKETDHLRETRVMKARGANALTGKDQTTSMYEVVKILGKGSFGVVRLVREKPENDLPTNPEKEKQIYAMKVIRKSDMLRNGQEGHLRAERDFLVSSEGSRWVVPLIASFQDLNNLYLVMDYMPGGDFLGLLIRDNVLTEPVAKWYTAEMILCIEEAHSLKWIHRDVKPDNFLISASGHLKISDFGLAFDGHWSHDQAYYNNHRYSLLNKLGITVEGDSIDKKEGRNIQAAMKLAQVMMGNKDKHERNSSNCSENESILNWRNRQGNRTLARSVVGTSQYMAPEVVRGELYDARCDWWSVAIILFECIYGHTPFLADEGGRQQTKLNILNHKSTFNFPHKPVVSRRCQDLIRSMLQEKEHRLCSRRYKLKIESPTRRHQDYAGRYVYPNDAEDIKAHKWFRDIQWDRLHMMVPPFIPDIKSVDDTHYFDEEEPISDFSESVSNEQIVMEDVTEALKPFNREIQILAAGFIDRPYDSMRLRKVEKEIDGFVISEEQKEYLKAFVKHYGRKEKKRPRDRLLRDREISGKVLELRKKGAFLGYTYRRIRTGKESIGRGVSVGTGAGKRTVWHRARVSIH